MADVVVVGAGMGGLAAALELTRAGLAVTVVERARYPGGKVRELDVNGTFMDSGPTVLTMKWVFDELFALAGSSLEDHITMTPARVLARHAWQDGTRLDLHADPLATEAALGDFAGAGAVRGFRAFRQRAQEVYETLEDSFIRAGRPSPMGLVSRAGGVTKLLRIKPFETLWRELGTFFDDVRLRQLFGRYATYCGSSPFLAPATLMLVAHVEQAGVWRVQGGMQRLPEALASLATQRGARFRYGLGVDRVVVERGRVTAVELSNGERLDARAVVLNADVSAVANGLFGPQARAVVSPVPVRDRSLSAVTLNLNTPVGGFPLSRHNVFFSANTQAEFDDLFVHARLPRDPTVYVCAQDRDDGPHAPTPERLFCIINAPALGDRPAFHPNDTTALAQRALDLLRRCGLQLDVTPQQCRITTPADFESRFPGTGGAIYGRATHGAMATFRRPAARTAVSGLFLAGGSVHPGPGVPMAALSGRQAARCVLEDWRPTVPTAAPTRP